MECSCYHVTRAAASKPCLTFVGAFVGDLTGVADVQPQLRTAGEYVAQLPPAVMSTPVDQAVWPPPPLDKTTDEWAASRNGRFCQIVAAEEEQHLGVRGEMRVAVFTQPAGMVVFL